jgi:transketolase
MIRLEPIEKKFLAFGFSTSRVNGHNLSELRSCLSESYDHPHVIIADTIKGKGVSFMENRYEFHTIIPNSPEQISRGLKDLS